MTSSDMACHIIGQERPSDIVITCDHASNRVPPQVNGGDLGLPPAEMERHIAYDVGAAGVARHLGALMDAPVICSDFSRLVIDPNRGEDDPTLIMQIYDGTIIPANRNLTDEQVNWRLENCYRPYHAALAGLLDSRARPVMVAIHSFTPRLNGHAMRPWHIGILHGRDQRLALPLLARLRAEPDLCVGENEPYGGHLDGDSIDRHAIRHDRPNVLIELRNDLIRAPEQQQHWAARLAPTLQEVIAAADL
ncbi:MAG: N-formylglutamate amidohydrolase [Paracoccaceae bacterium]|nr:N-formylglutamate amidohydrolase [Paracoccaceae bacterium]